MQIAQCIAPLTPPQFLLATASAVFCRADESEPVIDIHQHTDYSGRTDEKLVTHQRRMGVTHTVLLPAGRFFGLNALLRDEDHARRQVDVWQRLQRSGWGRGEVQWSADDRSNPLAFTGKRDRTEAPFR